MLRIKDDEIFFPVLGVICNRALEVHSKFKKGMNVSAGLQTPPNKEAERQWQVTSNKLLIPTCHLPLILVKHLSDFFVICGFS